MSSLYFTKKIVIVLVLVECFIITALAYRLYRKFQPKAYITSLNNNDFTATSSGSLQYYYERSPGIKNGNRYPWIPHRVTYHVNSDTLNAMREYAIPKPSNIYRIVAIGDSFTFGQFVNTEQAWPSILEQLLNSDSRCKGRNLFEVLNLGVPGYDAQFSVERLRKRGLKYTPDLVIWLYFGNDFDQFAGYMYKFQTDKNTKPDAAANNANYNPDEIKKMLSRLYAMFDVQSIKHIQYDALRQMRAVYSGPMLYATFPSTEEEYRLKIQNLTQRYPYSYHFPLVTDTVENPSFSFLPEDPHPNIKGHAAIAKSLYDYLIRSGLVSCN